MVKEYWERIDKEIGDVLANAVLLSLFVNSAYATLLESLVACLESERKRLGIRWVKNE